MSEALTIMLWPLIACLLLPGILVYYGLHMVRREIIFVDLALAQVAALGICVAILLKHESHDWQTYAWSLGFTFVGAAIFTLTRTRGHRVPQEALIGIVYVVAAASAILLLSQSAEGNEELKRTLVGDILLVQPGEVLRAFALYAVVAIIHLLFRKRFLMISFEPARAVAEGVSVRGWGFLFYVLFGFVVTSFVRIGGVLLLVVVAARFGRKPGGGQRSSEVACRTSYGASSMRQEVLSRIHARSALPGDSFQCARIPPVTDGVVYGSSQRCVSACPSAK